MADAFIADKFIGGKARSSIGDEGCVVTNTATQLNMQVPEILGAVVSLVADTSITVPKHIYYVPGVVLQLTHPSDTSLSVMVEVEDVTDVSADNARLDIVPGYVFGAGFAGGSVSLGQNFLRPQVVYGSAAAQGMWGNQYVVDSLEYQDYSPPGVAWVGNQWAGYYALFDGGDLLQVHSNSDTFLTFQTSAGYGNIDNVQVALAKYWADSSSFADRVPGWELTALSHGMSTLLEPALDLERRGTELYGHNHLLDGPSGTPVNSGWLANDIGAMITTTGLVDFRAKSVSLSLDGLTLTVYPVTAMTNDEYVGSFLNPNQNQGLLFKIVSNTSNTITVDASMTGAFSPAEVAYVIGPRVAVKYQRLLGQLEQYKAPNARVHILFA